MCLAIPGRVLEIFDEAGLRMARADFGGTVRRICLEPLPEATTGDYVLVHVGLALGRIDADEAARTYAALAELGQLDELAQEAS
jgi:hydrogenase expression/formation protein HypC